MKNEAQYPLKVSLHGMNERMQIMIINYLKLICNNMAIIVEEREAEAEIIDADFYHSKSLLEHRLARQSSKPIIAISLQEVQSNELIYVKKPVEVKDFVRAISAAKELVENNATLKQTEINIKSSNIAVSETVKQPTASIQPEIEDTDIFDLPEIIDENIYDLPASASSLILITDKQKDKTSELVSQVSAFTNKDKPKIAQDNQRGEIRYVFDGLKGILEKKSLIMIKNSLPILIQNVSSKGALIQYDVLLKLRSKVMLKFRFRSHHIFSIPAQVVRKQEDNSYGLLFNKRNDEFIDFLIESGSLFNITSMESSFLSDKT